MREFTIPLIGGKFSRFTFRPITRPVRVFLYLFVDSTRARAYSSIHGGAAWGGALDLLRC